MSVGRLMGAVWSTVALVGCGPIVDVVDTGDRGDPSTGPVGTDSGPTPPQPPEPTPPPPQPVTTGPLGTTTSAGVTTTGSTGEPPESVCEPQPQDTFARVTVDTPQRPKSGDLLVEEVCEVTGEVNAAGEFQLILSCPTVDPLLVRLASDPSVDFDASFSVGQQLDVRAARNFVIDGGSYNFVALREPGGNLIAGQYGWGEPPAGLNPAPWFAPIAFGPIDGVCETDFWEEQRSFIEEPCPADVRRMAIDFILDFSTTRIYDGNRTYIGPYDVYVGTARRYIPVEDQCPKGEESVSITWAALPTG